jgi:hypothetical protein
MIDGHQRYKLILYLGDGKAVNLWNRAGKLDAENGSHCPQCVKLQTVMDQMLANCKAAGSDLCVRKQDNLRYVVSRGYWSGGPAKCYALEFEPNELINFCAPTMTEEEAEAYTGEVCWQRGTTCNDVVGKP